MLYVKTMNLTTCKESIFASSLTVVQLSSVPMDTGTCTSNLKFSKFCYSLPYLRAKIRAMNYVQTIHPVSTVSAQSLFQNVTFLQSENAVLMNTLNLQWLRKCAQGLCDPWQDTVPESKERGGDHKCYTPSQGATVN